MNLLDHLALHGEVRLLDHLAHELTYVDDQIEAAANRNAWIEVEALELLRQQIRETRSVLIRQAIRVERHAEAVA